MIIILVIIITVIICYCVCVYCSSLVLSSVQSQPVDRSERLEKAYCTVSIVTCSIVPKDARGRATGHILRRNRLK